MAIAPWNVVGGGKIRTDAEEQRRLESGEEGRKLFGDWKRTPEQRQVCLELEQVAKEVGAKHITSVAIAWTMQKAPFVFPIIGGRKVEHLQQNLEALELHLTDEQIKRLDNIVPFNKGFPFAEFVRLYRFVYCEISRLTSLGDGRAMEAITALVTGRQATSTCGRSPSQSSPNSM